MTKTSVFLFLSVVLSVVGAFQFQRPSTISRRRHQASDTKLQAFSWPLWLDHFFSIDNQVDSNEKPTLVDKLPQDTTAGTSSLTATVVRLAARMYDKDASQPSSRKYTTRKNACPSVSLTSEGVVKDYNHYRTVALNSTKTRAVSIVTTDIMQALDVQFNIKEGDLGENILVDGLFFHDLQIEGYYKVGNDVILQVTEPMIPCANLCKLPCINDESLGPKQRIVKCQALLEFLDAPGDGFRGWYAQVVGGGTVNVGDEFRQVAVDEKL